MIITGLISLILSLLSLLFGLLPSIPSLPDSVVTVIDSVATYISDGAHIIAVFCYGSVVSVLLAVMITVFAAWEIYRLIMWVLRKIPMLGIE